MLYALVRHLHVTCVVISGCGFLLRGLWMIRRSLALDAPWVRIAPHIVDTLLLASAIALVVVSHQYPLEQNWVTAKILGLLVYIGLGTMALRRGRTQAVRIASWLAALATFGYIVSVALSRNAAGFLAWL